MAYKIVWSDDAVSSFETIIEYLEIKWTEKEIRNFVTEAQKIIAIISKSPNLFRNSSKESIHEVLVMKQNLLLYHVDEKNKTVLLISFWPTRTNPKFKP